MPRLQYPEAYCVELDCILPPDRARDAHSSFLNPHPEKRFTFFCPTPGCGCKLKGARIYRWEIDNGTAYYARYNRDAIHLDDCEFSYLNPTANIPGTTDPGEPGEHDREVLYPSYFSTLENEETYEFDFNADDLTIEEILYRIAIANQNLTNWDEIAITDLRIIIETYKAMSDEEKQNNYLRINDGNPLRYRNSFSEFKWLPNADGLYSHIYCGKIKNKRPRDSGNYFSFFLDWDNHDNKYRGRSFEVQINKDSIQETYLENLLTNGWNEAYFYAVDPRFEFDENTRDPIIVSPESYRHMAISIVN